MDQQLLYQLMHRPATANKYDFGHVVIVGGGPGAVGAPLMAGQAALRSGAGLVTIAADTHTIATLEERVEEIMTFSLPAYGDPQQAAAALLAFAAARKVSALAIGPGLRSEAAPFVRQLLAAWRQPAVIDAGALAAFRAHLPQLQAIAAANSSIIITPHAGEYARLTGTPAQERQELDRQAQHFATTHHLTVVIKGHQTLVAHPGGTAYLNNTGNPGMATAGTGDVLSGVIAGLLAQRLTAGQAAELGVYLHGLAGDLAVQTMTQPGLIASDLIAFLPAAFQHAQRRTS